MKHILLFITFVIFISCGKNDLSSPVKEIKINTELSAKDVLHINSASLEQEDELIVAQLDTSPNAILKEEDTKLLVGKLWPEERDSFLNADKFLVNLDITLENKGVVEGYLIDSRNRRISDLVVLENGKNIFETSDRAVIFDKISIQLSNINGVPVKKDEKVQNCFSGYIQLSNSHRFLKNICQGRKLDYYVRLEEEYKKVVKKTQRVKATYIDYVQYSRDRYVSETVTIEYFEESGFGERTGKFAENNSASLTMGSLNLANIYEEGSVNSIDLTSKNLTLFSNTYYTAAFVGLSKINGRGAEQMSQSFRLDKFSIANSAVGSIESTSDFGSLKRIPVKRNLKVDVYVY
jgi:hypothetical protein